MNKLAMFPPKSIAYGVNDALHGDRINTPDLYRSIEKEHGMKILSSHTGFKVTNRRGETVYTDGTYTPSKARGTEQCAQYRLRMFKFLRWAMVHASTDAMRAIEKRLKV